MVYTEKEIQGDEASLSCQKNERLNKNSDSTLDKEKPIVEEQSDSSISKIVPNDIVIQTV